MRGQGERAPLQPGALGSTAAEGPSRKAPTARTPRPAPPPFCAAAAAAKAPVKTVKVAWQPPENAADEMDRPRLLNCGDTLQLTCPPGQKHGVFKIANGGHLLRRLAGKRVARVVGCVSPSAVAHAKVAPPSLGSQEHALRSYLPRVASPPDPATQTACPRPASVRRVPP